jgi:hypothetical protein
MTVSARKQEIRRLAGNPRGPYAPSRERARFSSEFIAALLRDFRQGGSKAIERVRRTQPAAYMKICALLVPKEMKLEHSAGVKDLTDEQLEQAIEAVKAMLDQKAGDLAKVIEGTAEPAALPSPTDLRHPERKRSNRLLEHVDTAIGPSERGKRKP